MKGSMVDVAFGLAGSTLPREHRRALAQALEAALPALGQWPGAGVHRPKVVPGAGDQVLLPGHARLLLRVPRERADEVGSLAGRDLNVAGHRLRLGPPSRRELLPHNALYADLVLGAGGGDEARFLDTVDAQLRALGIACRRVCGQRRGAEGDRLDGYSLMLYELASADSLRVLECGLGEGRLLGCGLFVAHRSAAAVGG